MSRILKGLILGMSRVLNLFPYRWVSHCGGWAGELLYRLTHFRSDVVRDNLHQALGVDGPELEALVRSNYRHYGRAFADFILSTTWDGPTFLKKVRLEGADEMREALAQGRGVYILSCHLGSWELAIGTIAAAGIPLDVVVKKAQSPAVEDFLQWYRRKTGAGIFLETRTHQQILQSLGKGRAVGFILDQFMGPPIGLPVRFFDRQAGTAAALALLLERHPAPVVLAYGYRDEDDELHAAFSKPLDLTCEESDRVARMYHRTQVFNDALEEIIRRRPEQWLWLHRRWKAYRGEPRWKLARAATTVLLGFLLAGCSAFETSKTGIELPPDPEIKVPEFSAADQEDESPSIEEQQVAEAHAKKLGILKSDSPRKTAKAPPREKNEKKVKPKVEKKENPYKVLPVERIPFRVGERMVLDLTWVGLPAGTATLEVREGPEIGGRETFHLWGNVTSSRLVDAIYHVDNTVETFVDSMGLIPYKFLLHMVESKQLKETRVVFDHPNRKAHYWSKRISERWGNEELNNVDEIAPAAKDMWGALYYARTINYVQGKTYTFPVYEKGKNFDVSLTALENEIVRTPVGIFQAWKLGVKIRLAQHLKQTGDIFLWVGDDSNRYIVKFEGKIKIGSLKGTLIELKEK